MCSVLIVQNISSWVAWKEELAIAVSVSHSQFTLIKCVNWYLLTISSHLQNKKVFFETTCHCFQGRSWSIESRLYNSLYLVTSWPSWALVPWFLFAKRFRSLRMVILCPHCFKYVAVWCCSVKFDVAHRAQQKMTSSRLQAQMIECEKKPFQRLDR